MEQKVRQLVDSIQFGRCSEIKAIHYMTKVYNSVEYEEFTPFFIQVLQGFIQEDYNNPSVKNVLAFLGKFVGHITSMEAERAKDERPLSALLGEVIEQVIPYHSEPNEHCKFNVCSFISTTLQNIGNKVAVNGNIIKLIQEAMFENLQDSKPSIRLQAVLALARIQEPANLECPTMKTLETCLLDTNHLVRREVVIKIIPSPITLVGIQKRTRDIDANVRSAAFRRLAEIAPRFFKIVQRHYILKSGFLETDQRVQKIFTEFLIAKWLTSYNGNYLEFLKGIKLDADEDDIRDTEKLSHQIMDVFFKSQPIDQLIEILPLNDNKLIPEDSLQTERVLYWNIVIKYLRQSDELEDHLEQVIPELIIFCGYIQSLIDNTFSRKQSEGFEENLNFQNLLCHLFDIGENYDLSEEVGRKALEKLVGKCLKQHNWEPQLLKKLMQIGSKVATKVELFTNDVYNIIFDLWQPIKVTPHDTREHEFKLAQLRVKLNRLEDELNNAISIKDYEKSHKITMEMDEIRKKVESFSKEGPSPGESIRAVTEDSSKLCWCLDLLCAILMAHANYEPLPHSLIMCRDDFLMPLIVDKRVEIVTRALKCLGIYCIYDQELAKIHHHLGTFKVPIVQYKLNIDFNQTIFINSISLTCDLIIMHGMDWIANETNSTSPTNSDRVLYDDTEEVLSRDQILTFDFFIGVLVKMLDDEDDDIRDMSVTVFAKLMYHSIPINSTLLTRLILKWFNPSTTKTLHQKLGMILKAYIHSGNAAKKMVIDAIVPVLTVIANAPHGSPLADLNIDNAVQFLAIISDSGNSKGLMHLHTELARILVDEITLRPDENVTIYFAKMLNLLNINPDKSPAIRDIIANAELILERETLEKAPKQQLTKFVTKLKHCTNTTVHTSTVVNDDDNPKDNESPKRIVVGAIIESNQLNQPCTSSKQPDQTEQIQQSTSNQNLSSSGSDITVSSQSDAQPPAKSLRVQLNKLATKNISDGTKSSSDSDMASPPAKLQRLHLQKEIITRSARTKKTENRKADDRQKPDGGNNLEKENIRSTRRRGKEATTSNGNQNNIQDDTKSSSGSEMASPPAKLQRLTLQNGKITRSARTKTTEINTKSSENLEMNKTRNTRRKDEEATTNNKNQNIVQDKGINSTRYSLNTRTSTINSAEAIPRRSLRQENRIARRQEETNEDEDINSETNSSISNSTVHSEAEIARTRSMRPKKKYTRKLKENNKVPRSTSSEIFEQPSYSFRNSKETLVNAKKPRKIISSENNSDSSKESNSSEESGFSTPDIVPRRNTRRNPAYNGNTKNNNLGKKSSSEESGLSLSQKRVGRKNAQKNPAQARNARNNNLGNNKPSEESELSLPSEDSSQSNQNNSVNTSNAKKYNLRKSKLFEKSYLPSDTEDDNGSNQNSPVKNRNANKKKLRTEKSSGELYLPSDTEDYSGSNQNSPVNNRNTKKNNLRKTKSAEDSSELSSPEDIRKSGRKTPATRNAKNNDLRQNKASQQSTSSVDFQKSEKVPKKLPSSSRILQKTELEKNKTSSGPTKTLEKRNVAASSSPTAKNNSRIRSVLLEQVANSDSIIPVPQNKRKKMGRRSLRSELLDSTLENTPRILKRMRRVLPSSISTNSDEQTRRSYRTTKKK